MSSAATITFEPDTVCVPIDAWQAFCAEHALVYSPQTIGGNVYYAGEVEVHYATRRLVFSTYWRGAAIPEVARLAMIAWQRWGGEISADPEVRRLVYKESREMCEVPVQNETLLRVACVACKESALHVPMPIGKEALAAQAATYHWSLSNLSEVAERSILGPLCPACAERAASGDPS
jgi:hypothetical protein